MGRVGSFLEWFIQGGFVMGQAAIFFLMLVISYEVVMRYVLVMPTKWAFEMSGFLAATVVFSSVAYILTKGGHVRVTVLVARLPEKWQYLFYVVTTFLSFVYCGIWFWFSLQASWASYEKGVMSASAWAPPLYPIKFLITFGVALFALTCLRQVIGLLRSPGRKADWF